jgi:hypothetical protein
LIDVLKKPLSIDHPTRRPLGKPAHCGIVLPARFLQAQSVERFMGMAGEASVHVYERVLNPKLNQGYSSVNWHACAAFVSLAIHRNRAWPFFFRS